MTVLIIRHFISHMETNKTISMISYTHNVCNNMTTKLRTHVTMMIKVKDCTIMTNSLASCSSLAFNSFSNIGYSILVKARVKAWYR